MFGRIGVGLFFKVFFGFIYFSLIPTLVYIYYIGPKVEVGIVLWFVLFISIIVAFVIAHNIVSPLRTLIDGAKRISRGDFDVRVKIKSSDEIGQLADHFNRMAESLSFQHEKLEEEAKALIHRDRALSVINDQLQGERDRIRSIIADLSDGLLVFDKNNNLIIINPAARSMLELRKEELEGRQLRDLLIYPNFSRLVDIIGLGVVKKGVFRKELVLRDKERVLEVSTLPLIENTTITGFIVILHDITREKLVEQMKNEFISIAAHQLRTPLSAIKWMLKMIIDGDLGAISDEQKDILDKGYRTNERMISLINDLLDVSRIEEGRFLFEFSECGVDELEEIIDGTIKIFNPILEGKNIKHEFKKLISNFDEAKIKSIKVKIDSGKMKLAIQNIIENAIKYTKDWIEVSVSIDEERKEFIFCVKDNGIGIPKEQHERVFSKFFRGNNAIKLQAEGSGLGLFIVKNIIEKHGGKIWFESAEGKGTTFYFSLLIV